MFEKTKSIFVPPTPVQAAEKELEDARREVLKAYTSKDYAEAIIQYHEARIERLVAFLAEEAANEKLCRNGGSSLPYLS
jgi:hypothetical protein